MVNREGRYQGRCLPSRERVQCFTHGHLRCPEGCAAVRDEIEETEVCIAHELGGAASRLQMMWLFSISLRTSPGGVEHAFDTHWRTLGSVPQSVKFYGLLPASRRYRSFVLVSYPV
ncbi:hypothetical protein Tco_1163204 [Tanacetum coccineum]